MILAARHLEITIAERKLFSDLNFSVGEDEFMVIKTGVLDGATTLLKALLGLIESARGEVIFQGRDLLALRRTGEILELRRKIGIVYEAGGLVSLLNVFQNIGLPLIYHADFSETELNKKVLDVARRLNIEAILEKEPNELNDVQTRTVNLARALITEPQLLLIDELEGGMSVDHCNCLIDTIKDYQQSLHFGVIMTTVDQHADYGTSGFYIKDQCLNQEYG